MTENKRSKMHYAWWILIALCIIVGLGKSGLNNSAGLFLSPINKDLGIGIGDLSLYFSVSAIVTMIFLPIGGKLMAKYDVRYLTVVAVLLQAGAFALFGLMDKVWGWYILSVPLAVGGVFITLLLGPVLINQWFSQKAGLALGILSAAGGAIGMVVQPSVGYLIANHGWRSSYITVGLVAIAIIIPVALLLIKKSPNAIGLQPYGADMASANSAQEGAGKQANVQQGITFADAKKSLAFYSLMIFFFFITSIASFSMHIPNYLTNQGYDISAAGTVMGMYMMGILIGSLVIGVLTDKIGTKNTAILAMIVGLISIILLMSAGQNIQLITVAVTLFGVISSSIGTLGPALASTLFGNREYSQIYSLASMGLAISSIIALPAYGFIFDYLGSYTIVLYAIIAMLVLNILCVLFAFKGKDRMVQQGLWK